MAKITGTINGSVKWVDKEKLPVAAATVCAIDGKQSFTVATDKNGIFGFKDLSVKRPWTLVPMHHGGKALRTETVTFEAADKLDEAEVEVNVELKLNRVGGTPNNFIGICLLVFCMLCTLVLGYFYWEAHTKALAEFDQTGLIKLLAEADGLLPAMVAHRPEKLAEFADNLQTSLGQLKAYDYENILSAAPALSASVDMLRKRQVELAKLNGAAISDETSNAIEAEIAKLKDALRAIEPSYFWTKKPWLFAELWCWSLLGLLVQKIMRIGWYVRKNQYFAEGTWMHASHLIAVPILGSIGTLILSMVQFKSASGIVMDLSQPEALVVVAFLLSLFPWKLFDFIRLKSDELMK